MEDLSFDAELSQEKQLTLEQELKDEDEIRRFTIDEDLIESEKALMFLDGGHLVQQHWTITRLPNLVKTLKADEMEIIFNALCSKFASLDEELQDVVGSAFAEMLQQQILKESDISRWIAPIVLDTIALEWFPVHPIQWRFGRGAMQDVWLDCLKWILSKETMEMAASILAMANGRCDVEATTESRVICCKLLGCFVDAPTNSKSRQTVLRLATRLFQDTDYQVRTCMALQLPFLMRIVDSTSQGVLLEEFYELLNDEQSVVRIQAFEAMVDALPSFSKDLLEVSAKPVLQKYQQPRELDSEMQRCLAGRIGVLVFELSKSFKTENELNPFLSCFRFLVSRKDPEIRLRCAKQLPALLHVAGGRKYSVFFHDTFQNLSTDLNEDVRITIASQFHDIAKMLNSDVCAQYLPRVLRNLVNDDSHDVRIRILPSLRSVLERMHFLDDTEKLITVQPIVDGLCTTASISGRNWRLQHAWILAAAESSKTLFCFTKASFRLLNWIENETMVTKLVPIMFESLSHGTADVRRAAAHCLARILRSPLSEKQRTSIYVRLLREYWKSPSFSGRMSFIDVSAFILQIFSASFFKAYFLDFYMDLFYDSIPNVRLHALRWLPELKQTIELPQDVHQLERLNNAMSNLMMDRDSDVSEGARSVHARFKQLALRMAGGAGMLDMNGMAGGLSIFEAEDSKKRNEETDITLSTEEAELMRSDRGVHDINSRLRNTRISDSSTNFSFASSPRRPKTTDKLTAATKKAVGKERQIRSRLQTSSPVIELKAQWIRFSDASRSLSEMTSEMETVDDEMMFLRAEGADDYFHMI